MYVQSIQCTKSIQINVCGNKLHVWFYYCEWFHTTEKILGSVWRLSWAGIEWQSHKWTIRSEIGKICKMYGMKINGGGFDWYYYQ